jgi:hypothetical protein
MSKVNVKAVMIEELLNTIYNGNYGTLDKNKTYKSYINRLTKKDLESYVGGYKLYGTKKEMLKQMCEVCNGIDINIDRRVV